MHTVSESCVLSIAPPQACGACVPYWFCTHTQSRTVCVFIVCSFLSVCVGYFAPHYDLMALDVSYVLQYFVLCVCVWLHNQQTFNHICFSKCESRLCDLFHSSSFAAAAAAARCSTTRSELCFGVSHLCVFVICTYMCHYTFFRRRRRAILHHTYFHTYRNIMRVLEELSLMLTVSWRLTNTSSHTHTVMAVICHKSETLSECLYWIWYLNFLWITFFWLNIT